MSRPAVDIVIVDYDAGPLLGDCLVSIASLQPTFASLGRVVVVDNGSRDSTRRRIQELDLPITLIRNPENRGFAAACNQGTRGSDAEYLLFLNPDTRLAEHALDIPARFLSVSENRDVGIVGIQLVDDQGRVVPTCRRFPNPSHYWSRALGLERICPSWFSAGDMGDWDHADTRRVDQVMGAFFFVRRRLFEALGGFDERFFVYFEEVDFSVRALRAGWSSVFLSDAKAFHAGRGTTDRIKARRGFYSLRSRILYAYKHFSLPSATSVLFVTLLVEPVSRVLFSLTRRAWEDAGDTVMAYAMLWSSLPGLLRCALRPTRGDAPAATS